MITSEISNSQGKDITGCKFGKLTAIRPTGQRKNGKVIWECICDCGEKCFIRDNALKYQTKSCGCLKKEQDKHNLGKDVKDLLGQKFNKLTVIRLVSKKYKEGNRLVWECLCDCGETVYEASNKLTSGHTKSCGCIRCPNLIGKRFGKLTVLDKTNKKTKDGSTIWACQCECNEVCHISHGILTSGGKKSCGCLRSPNLIGKVFGKLTVKARHKKNSILLCECKCKCGNICHVNPGNLNSGVTKSCGCINSPSLIGEKFGKLLVLEKTNKKKEKDRSIIWKCQCDCGNVHYVATGMLNDNRIKSCGCTTQSYGSELIEKYLIKNNYKFKKERTFPKCVYKGKLRFDFYIEYKSLLIEFNGKQHYEPVKSWGGEKEFKLIQKRDKIKLKYCQDNDIPLLVVPYWDESNIENLLNEFLSL